MSRLLQQLISGPIDPSVREARERVQPFFADDDIALGFECAAPALQFDSWDPAPLPPSPVPGY